MYAHSHTHSITCTHIICDNIAIHTVTHAFTFIVMTNHTARTTHRSSWLLTTCELLIAAVIMRGLVKCHEDNFFKCEKRGDHYVRTGAEKVVGLTLNQYQTPILVFSLLPPPSPLSDNHDNCWFVRPLITLLTASFHEMVCSRQRQCDGRASTETYTHFHQKTCSKKVEHTFLWFESLDFDWLSQKKYTRVTSKKRVCVQQLGRTA